MVAMHWLMLCVGVVMSAVGGLCLKSGATSIDYNVGAGSVAWQLISSWKLIVGVMFYVIPVMIWIFLLKRVDLSLLQPLFSLVYVVTPVLAVYVLGEEVSGLRWLGIAVIMVGVAIVAQS